MDSPVSKKSSPLQLKSSDAEELGSSASARAASLRKRPPPSAVTSTAEAAEVRHAEAVVSPRVLSLRKRKQPSPPEDADEEQSSNEGRRSRSARNKKSHPPRASKGKGKMPDTDNNAEDEQAAEEVGEVEEEEEEEEVREAATLNISPQKRKAVPRSNASAVEDWSFLGDPIPEAEAKERWPERYQHKNGGGRGSASFSTKNEDDEEKKARRHYLQAKVDNVVYNLYDDAYVKAEGEDDYICRIVEFFEGVDQQLYFTAQWFFRAKDTVIKDHADIHDDRRVFLSEERTDNVLDCIVSKIKIARVAPNIDLEAKEETIPHCDLYYDMSYSLAYSTFANLPPENGRAGSEASSTISSEDALNLSSVKTLCKDDTCSSVSRKDELSLLDLYSGCGAMSTGLCLGANLSGVNLQTRWAVDINKFACESLKLNHPETEVRNEKAENFLALIREWEKLCKKYSLLGTESSFGRGIESHNSDDEVDDLSGTTNGEFEVGKLVGICYGDPHNIGKVGLKFKVRWKGYGPSDDTWEPVDGLSKCQERIECFVINGFKRNILPLPGNVDVICGGPPCQGISGFNRFRNKNAPLEDPKNQQMVVFMDIVEFLKPKYVLMENVVDILKFAQGFLGRYALSRLVAMNYQARLGILAAGCFGLPQFRMRCFLWGAQPTKKLPQFPLPTHDVVVRGGVPNEFEQNLVAYNEHQQPKLEKALLLGDAISDLPPATNNESSDEVPYGRPPKTDFQRFIRLSQQELGYTSFGDNKQPSKGKLFDHVPLQLNEDDYQRVCQIPKRKGACFRDLPGVVVGPENVVEWDPNVPRVLLSSGKPLVPDYAMSFIKGKSSKPFARLWWDETVPTVVTRAEPHNQAILHPEQDRVLTIRENARLQGFPDYYKLCGPVKERYIQVGNAVAVPVSRALGYGLGLAYGGDGDNQPILSLPQKFPLARQSPVTSES